MAKNIQKAYLPDFALALLYRHVISKAFKYDLMNYAIRLMIIKAKDLN